MSTNDPQAIGNAQNAALCLNSNWLDTKTAGDTLDADGVNFIQTTDNFTGWTQPYTLYSNYWPHTYERKISLTLSEVMHLRTVAANDKKLRKTLKKFAPHIEITVDFPG